MSLGAKITMGPCLSLSNYLSVKRMLNSVRAQSWNSPLKLGLGRVNFVYTKLDVCGGCEWRVAQRTRHPHRVISLTTGIRLCCTVKGSLCFRWLYVMFQKWYIPCCLNRLYVGSTAPLSPAAVHTCSIYHKSEPWDKDGCQSLHWNVCYHPSCLYTSFFLHLTFFFLEHYIARFDDRWNRFFKFAGI